jgi:hypothetical protein
MGIFFEDYPNSGTKSNKVVKNEKNESEPSKVTCSKN